MPYTAKQTKFFNAVAHGMKPRNGSKLSKPKARELSKEANRLPVRAAVSR